MCIARTLHSLVRGLLFVFLLLRSLGHFACHSRVMRWIRRGDMASIRPLYGDKTSVATSTSPSARVVRHTQVSIIPLLTL